MTTWPKNPWFPRVIRRDAPEVRLLCLGGAGTGPSEFAVWPSELPKSIEVWPAQLPGRERRIREEPARRIGDLVDALADEVRQVYEPGGPPWALFGHSFGSLVAYEVARRLLTEHSVPIVGLVVSSIVVPHLQRMRIPVASSDCDSLLDWIRDSGGTESSFLEDERFSAWLVEDLRATLRIRRSYSPVMPEPLACPIFAVGGAGDLDATKNDLSQWEDYSKSGFRQGEIGHGHFFLRTHRSELLKEVSHQLDQWNSVYQSANS